MLKYKVEENKKEVKILIKNTDTGEDFGLNTKYDKEHKNFDRKIVENKINYLI